MGGVLITDPFSASNTTSILLSHPANKRFVLRSIDKPEGDSPGAIDDVFFNLNFFISISLIELLFAIFTNTFPAPSLTAVSGLPLKAIVSITRSVTGSIIEILLLLPLQVM